MSGLLVQSRTVDVNPLTPRVSCGVKVILTSESSETSLSFLQMKFEICLEF